MEKYVVHWCLDNIVPFRYLSKRSCLLIAYEDLVIYPEKTIERIIDYCGFSYDTKRKMMKNINKPSGSTIWSEPETIDMIFQSNSEALISGWRDKVSSKDIDKCFDIIEHFGIDLYSRDSDLPNKKYNIHIVEKT